MSSTLLNFTMTHIQKQQQRFIEQLKGMVADYHTWNNVQDQFPFADPSWEGFEHDEESDEESESDDEFGAELIQDEYVSLSSVEEGEELYIYKFRDECPVDVFRFSQKLTEKNISFYMKSVDDGWELKSPAGFMEIIRVANETDDCHVIVDTFELKENYTGERKYRCGNVEDIEMPC